MDPFLIEKECKITEFQHLEITPTTPDPNYALEENIPAAGHRQETNHLVGQICEKQFNQMSQESDNAAIVYERGSMKGRVTLQSPEKTQKVINYMDVLTSDMKLWRKWVQNDYKQTEIEVAHDRAIARTLAYWAVIKDNFADRVKKLHELSHHST